MSQRRLVVTVTAFIVTAALHAPNLRAEDLLEVYAQGAKNDAQLRAARAALDAALEVKPQAQARFLPTVHFGANYTRERDKVDPNTGSSYSNNYPSTGYNLTLTQPLYHSDAFAQSDQADAQARQAEMQFRAEQQGLSTRVAERYFEVLAAQDNLAFVKAENESTGKQLEQTKQRFNVGLIAITDVHEAQARYDLSQAQVVSADNRLANAWESLREVTGQTYTTLATLTPDTPLVVPAPADIEQWVQGALKQNPQLLAVQSATDAAQSEIQRQRGAGNPTLDLVGAYANNNNKDATLGADRTGTSLSVQLNWNLYQGGAVQSAERRASYLYTQSKETLELQRRGTILQTREAYLAVQAGIGSVNALKQAVVSNKSALSATEAGYEVGTRTTVDVLNARSNLFRAQRDYAQSRYDYILATLRLKSAAGNLDEDALKQVNAWLKK